MRSWLTLLAGSSAALVTMVANAAPVPPEYTVQEGDTCAAIAQRFYGDTRRVDLIHDANPGWGAPPHVLKPGQVIKLLPKPAKPLPPDAKASYALVTRVRGSAQIDGAAGKPGDPLARGNHLTTAAASGAEVVLGDETRVRLSESTELVVAAPKNAVKGSAAGDEVLASGTARVKMGDPAGRRPMNVATATGRANVRGEAQVSVDASNALRVAAYANTSQLVAHGKTVDVRPSFGVKAEAGKAPGKPKPLPATPTFGSPPPAVVFVNTQGGVAAVSGSYGPGSGGGDMPVEFHLQLARDEDFGDVVQDFKAPSSNTALDVKDLAIGTYFIHVSAIDADKFEGPYSPARKVTIGDIKITPKGKRRATVEVSPGGAYCGVAGGPLAPIAGEFEIDTVRATSVRCAPTPDGAITVRDVAAAKIGLRVVDAKVTHAQGAFEEGEVLIHLADSDNAPLDGVEVKSNAGADSTVGVFVAAGSPGAYKAPARWKKGASTLSFSVKVGDEEAAAPPAALELGPTQAPPPPPEAKTARAAIEIHADGGFAAVNSGLDQAGGRGRVGVGYGIVLGPGILAVGVDGSLEGYNREPFPGVSPSGAPAGFVAVGKLHAFGVSLPIQYRYGNYDKFFRPYIGLTPEALFESASFSYLVGDHAASSVIQSSATVLALTGILGGEVKVGPGAIFAEVGYRGTQVVSRDPASVNLHGFVSGVGYRATITY